jgi:subtilisin family serine protease
MRPVVSALAAAGAILCGVAGAAGSYDDSVCRAGAAGWASDPCAGRQWGLTKVRAPEAWRFSRGGGVVVAVVDTGADFRHPDLRANLIAKPGSNLIRNTVSTCPFHHRRAMRVRAVAQDDNGHGTHVAGTIAAVTGNGLGVAGVAPKAKVLPVKVLNAQGRGTDRAVARGICFAVRHGARVINLSLGGDPLTQIVVVGEGDETSRAIGYAYSRGVAVVIAAGNEGFPACGLAGAREKSLCVGATDRNDLKAVYSNFGDTLGVVAPGGFSDASCPSDADVWSTGWPGARHRCGRAAYQSLAGTSMATPHVAGIAALLKARLGRRATPAFVYDRIRRTADDLGLPGADPVFGHGRVNALRAVQG